MSTWGFKQPDVSPCRVRQLSFSEVPRLDKWNVMPRGWNTHCSRTFQHANLGTWEKLFWRTLSINGEPNNSRFSGCCKRCTCRRRRRCQQRMRLRVKQRRPDDLKFCVTNLSGRSGWNTLHTAIRKWHMLVPSSGKKSRCCTADVYVHQSVNQLYNNNKMPKEVLLFSTACRAFTD